MSIIRRHKRRAPIFLWTTEILSFKEKNIVYNDKFKNVFFCKSKEKEDGQMCIMWGRTSANTGDKVEIKCKFLNNVILVKSMLVIERKKQDE